MREEKTPEKSEWKNNEFTTPNKNGGRELTQPHTSHCVTRRPTPCHTVCRLSLTPKSSPRNWAVLIVVAQSPPICGAGRFPTCGPAAEPQLQGYGRAEWCVAQHHQIGTHARGVEARTGLGARVLGCKRVHKVQRCRCPGCKSGCKCTLGVQRCRCPGCKSGCKCTLGVHEFGV
jgi:hypothetical protein